MAVVSLVARSVLLLGTARLHPELFFRILSGQIAKPVAGIGVLMPAYNDYDVFILDEISSCERYV